MKRDEFVKYWDNVIRAWFMCANGQYEIPPFDYNRKKNLSPESNKDLEEQITMIESINTTVGKNHKKYTIHPSHMPEPYWGDPDNCSIVLLDYNPAGGSNVSYQTSIECVDCGKFPNSLTKFVKNHKYSELAKGFPLLQDGKKPIMVYLEDDTSEDISWITKYGGYQWWQEKKEWLNHIAKEIPLNNNLDYMPFGMELIGWHSEGWGNNMRWVNNDNYIPTILSETVLEPLFDTVINNNTIAVCIGAEFKFTTLQNLNNTNKGYRIEDKTECVICLKSNKLNQKYSAKLEQDSKNKKDISIKVVKKDKIRYYRLYKMIKGNDNIFILNTWAQGGNKQPAEHFWEAENIILNAIGKL